MTRIGPFLLVDPPPGQPGMIEATVDAIDFPWDRLDARLAKDPDQAVLVRYLDTGQSANGLFFGRTLEIHLGTRYEGWEAGVPFVFAHEVGHLVDHALLTFDRREDLLGLMHRSPGPWDSNPNAVEWHHDQDHAEAWVSSNPYLFRPSESYADEFVAAFAPTIWGQRAPRFVHWTDDLAAIRSVTLLPKETTVARIAGITRYETAVQASRHRFPSGTTARVYLASGEQFPDALVAASMADDGPLLLVPSTSPVPQVVLDEARRLRPQEVVVVGGTAAVSEANAKAVRDAAAA